MHVRFHLPFPSRKLTCDGTAMAGGLVVGLGLHVIGLEQLSNPSKQS